MSVDRAIDALALAERAVRWEDDVSPAELRLFCSMYQDVLRRARQELMDDAPLTAAAQADDTRSGLLRLRFEACEMVRRAERARRRAQPSAGTSWRRYVAAVLMLGLFAIIAGRDAIADQLDLGNVSHGKQWVASSHYAPNAAVSGTLGDFSAPFFFHTAYEVNPWIELDLGAETPVRSVTVHNRVDCCSNRALPLVIETSLDHQAWQLAASRKQNFERWRTRLAVNTARWLRLRTSRQSHLHLQGIVVRN